MVFLEPSTLHNAYVFRLIVGWSTDLELEQRCEDLLQYRADVLERQRRELVLFEKVVKVLLEHLKHEAGVRAVLEALVRADEVELVRRLLRQPGEDGHLEGQSYLI